MNGYLAKKSYISQLVEHVIANYLKYNYKISKEKLEQYLYNIKLNIHNSANRTRYSMNNFVIALGSFYKPLQKEALEVAKNIGKIYVDMGETNCKTPLATKYIQKAISKTNN